MEYKMGMRLIFFFTVWDIRYLENCLFYKLQGLKERKIDKFIANETNQLRLCPNTMTEILESFYKVWPWNKLKEPVLSVIRLEGYVNFFIGKILQGLYFSSNAVVKTGNLKEGFLRSFFANFALPVIGKYDPNLV